MNKKSFTLIELLVVIAIIGIMTAIITPVMNNAREGARRSQCSSNLRQIGIAMHMFIDDHDFKFPGIWDSAVGKYWYGRLEPYVDNKEIYRCPDYKYHSYTTPQGRFSYGFNYTGLNENMGGGNYKGRDLNYVKSYSSPTVCIMVSDGGTTNSADPLISYYIVNATVGSRFPVARHTNGINVLFVDGHVTWHHISEIPTSTSPLAERQQRWNY